MPNIMPSQAAEIIRNLFAHVTTEPPTDGKLQTGHLIKLKSIIDLVQEIPRELIIVPSSDYALFVRAIAVIEINLDIMMHRGGSFGIEPVEGVDAATVIYRALTKCPDEYPSNATSELAFIPNEALRRSIRIDISGVARAISNAEWKAAAILGGAAIEALLYWKVGQFPEKDVDAALKKAIAAGTLDAKNTPSGRDKWVLHQLIEISKELKVIKENTAKEARISKHYRNLIHPGAAERLGEDCDQGAAMSAAGALQHVVRDLTPH